MKRLFVLLLCLMLMIAPLQALAAQGDVIVPMDEAGILTNGVATSCVMGDGLYMLLYEDCDELLVHRAGQVEPEKYAIQIGEDFDRDNAYANYRLLSDGEQVYALRLLTEYTEEYENVSAELYTIALDGAQATAELHSRPDWNVFQSSDGYYNYVETVEMVGNVLLMCTYDDVGKRICYQMQVGSDAIEPAAIEDEVVMVTPYTDGKALVQTYANEERTLIQMSAYNPADGGLQLLFEREVEPYGQMDRVVCDPETGKLYTVQGGEIFELDPSTGELGEAITDMPLAIYSDNAAGILTGGYYATASYDGYALRNLSPGEERGARLKVFDGSYSGDISTAFYEFANAHGDVSTVLSHDYTSQEGLIDAMMNRENDVDVYILNGASKEFEAVFNRGYILDFAGSEKLMALKERIHPGLLEQLSVDGEFAVFPIECYFWMPFANTGALERIGMTAEELPTSWDEFLDFLMNDLPQRLPGDGSVRLFDPWTSDKYARMMLFEQIFSGYQQLLADDPDAFSSQQMIELLKKLEKVDFAALGQPTEEETNSETYNPEYNEDGYLLSLNMGMPISGITRDYWPMVMSMNADTPRRLSVTTQVAFINPFTEHPELALEFVESLTEHLSESTAYTLFTDLKEPVLNEYYEEGLQSLQEHVDTLRADLEKAEEIDKQDIMMALEDAEEYLADYEQYRYSVTEKDIAWLEDHAQYMEVMGVDWLYSDDTGEAYELVSQYSEGMINAEKLMTEIDRKIRMMMMEGY